MAMLKQYWWPGNIRELENLIERLVAVSDKDYISEEDLPLEFHFAQLEPAGRAHRTACSRTRRTRSSATSSFERSRRMRLECDRDGRVSWNSTKYVEVQNGQARRATACETTARCLKPANELGHAGQAGCPPLRKSR